MSGILFSNSVFSVSYLVFKANLLVSILFTFSANLSYTVFWQHHFLLYCLVYLNQQKQVLTCQYLVYLLHFLNWLNLFKCKTWSINMWNNFDICFCCIVRQINFNINISTKWFLWFSKVLAHFYMRKFH